MSKEEIEELDLDSSSVISGLASGMLTYCSEQNKGFLKCKANNDGNPEKCINEAIDLRKCGFTL
jgi:hypothetical protein